MKNIERLCEFITIYNNIVYVINNNAHLSKSIKHTQICEDFGKQFKIIKIHKK